MEIADFKYMYAEKKVKICIHLVKLQNAVADELVVQNSVEQLSCLVYGAFSCATVPCNLVSTCTFRSCQLASCPQKLPENRHAVYSRQLVA